MATNPSYDDLMRMMMRNAFGTPGFTSTSTNQPTKSSTPMKYGIGDRVRLKDYSAFGDWRQHEGEECTILEIRASSYGVGWNDGTTSNAVTDENIVGQTKATKATKATKLEEAKLEPLVINIEAKAEIIAVLKQHHHAAKLFDDWGLGEVIEYGRGMTFLFYGPPGTGKTFGAYCIAKSLGKELLTIGAAEIQTSEPGGANRNIQNAFKSAKNQNKVLFIDECDSLITNRQSVGMIIGSEINTLLTEIEHFEGVLILATNMVETLDEALERRISLIVEFPDPTFEQRRAIWEKMLPKKMPLAKDVDLTKLAEHKLTGGQIKNCVLQGARLALASEKKEVSMAHFDAAVARVQKSKSLLGSASRWSNHKVKEEFSISKG